MGRPVSCKPVQEQKRLKIPVVRAQIQPAANKKYGKDRGKDNPEPLHEGQIFRVEHLAILMQPLFLDCQALIGSSQQRSYSTPHVHESLLLV